MAYNHGVAKAIFEAEWKKKAAEYRKHGIRMAKPIGCAEPMMKRLSYAVYHR